MSRVFRQGQSWSENRTDSLEMTENINKAEKKQPDRFFTIFRSVDCTVQKETGKTQSSKLTEL